MRGRVLVPGTAAGALLRLAAPLSFWGGVDPETARIIDVRHPQHGACLSGRMVALAALRGSSSSSAVMLELLRRRIAPAALILGEVDAILLLGILVAREMGYGTIPALEIPAAAHIDLPLQLHIAQDGALAAA
jgi:predicted aconitase with swiveling domain